MDFSNYTQHPYAPPKLHPLPSPDQLRFNYGLTTDKQGDGIAMAWDSPSIAFKNVQNE
jgi:hypothetical protein